MSTFRKFWENRPRTDFYEYFNDFIETSDYTAGDWGITNGGSPTIATDTDGVGGILVATTGATDTNSTVHLHDNEVFKFEAGKAFEFETRFALDDVTDSIFGIGVTVTDTTPNAATDQLWFLKNDTEATLNFRVTADGTTVSELADFTTLVDDTYVKIGFYYDGDGDTIQVFLNDVRVGAVPITNAPDTEMCVGFAVATGKTGAVAASIDYIRAIAER